MHWISTELFALEGSMLRGEISLKPWKEWTFLWNIASVCYCNALKSIWKTQFKFKNAINNISTSRSTSYNIYCTICIVCSNFSQEKEWCRDLVYRNTMVVILRPHLRWWEWYITPLLYSIQLMPWVVVVHHLCPQWLLITREVWQDRVIVIITMVIHMKGLPHGKQAYQTYIKPEEDRYPTAVLPQILLLLYQEQRSSDPQSREAHTSGVATLTQVTILMMTLYRKTRWV